MKAILCIALFLAVNAGTSPSNAQSPLSAGRRPTEVLTLSQSAYPEVFENDSIVRIGSMLFNTKARCVVAFLNEDPEQCFSFHQQVKHDETEEATTTSYGYRMHDPRAGRFLSIDPLAAKYAWNSPYAFAENKVIQFIELEGAEILWNMADAHRYEREMLNKLYPPDEAERQFQLNRMGEMYGALAGLAMVADVTLAKGRCSQFLWSVMMAQTFEHNKATSPAGAAAQDQRVRENLSALMLGFAGAKVAGMIAEGFSQAWAGIPAKVGTLTVEAGGTFSASELRAAGYMQGLGKDVTLRMPQGPRMAGGTSDLLVDGARYDVYTPTTSSPDRIISAMAKKNSQATGIVLDLTESSVKAADLGNVLERVQGAGAKNIKDIQIIGGR